MPQQDKKPSEIETLKLEVSDLTERFETFQKPVKTPESLKIEDIKKDLNIYGSWIYQGVQRANSSVPTHSPKNREEQFYIYKNGSTFRLYIWVDGDWKYISLT